MDLIILLYFFLFYVIFFNAFIQRNAYIFSAIFILIVFFYDFIFIQISPFVDNGIFYTIKSWQEYLLIVILLITFLKTYVKDKLTYQIFDKNIIVVLILLTLSGFLVSITQSGNLFNAFLGWRTYILPFLLTFLIYKSKILSSTSFQLINFLIILSSVSMVIYAIYIDITFSGDLRELWFYDYINEITPLSEARPNYVRDDKLRATGFFVSPLIYSSFLSYTTLIVFYYLLFSTYTSKIFYFLILALIVYGLFIARTRIGLIIFIMGFFSSLLIYYKPWLKLRTILTIPFLLIALTFLTLLFNLTSDPSALGRLSQYAGLSDNLSLLGLGFGHKFTVTYFDSWYISSILLFGLLFPAYLYIHYLVIKKLHRHIPLYNTELVSKHGKAFFFASYGFIISFVYTFAFQYILGSATVYFLYIMSFLLISHIERMNHIHNS